MATVFGLQILNRAKMFIFVPRKYWSKTAVSKTLRQAICDLDISLNEGLSVALLVFPNGEVLEMNMNPNIAIIQIAFFGHIYSCIHNFLAYMLDDYKCDLGSIAHYCFILLDDLMLPKELGVYCLIAYALCNLPIQDYQPIQQKTVNWTPFLFKLPNAVLTMFLMW
ncbi:hypothetical protein ACJX0J_008537, partial [Zea mays]